MLNILKVRNKIKCSIHVIMKKILLIIINTSFQIICSQAYDGLEKHVFQHTTLFFNKL